MASKKSASAQNDVIAQQLSVESDQIDKVEWRQEDVDGGAGQISYLVWLKDNDNGPYQGRVDRATYDELKK